MPRTADRSVAADAAPTLPGAPDVTARRGRYLRCLIGGTIGVLAIGCAALAAAGLLAWAPLVLLAAVPVALRVSDAVSSLFTVILVRPTPAPPRLAGSALARAMAETAVVYPAIVGSLADVETVVASVRENRDAVGRGPALHLALIDFADSRNLCDGADDALRRALAEGIATVDNRPTPTVVLFRRRRWSAAQGVYMGWERKRGKIEELVALIGGRDDTDFVDLDAGLVELLRTLRYLVTVDVGDRLEPRAARRLIGVIAHPENAAVVAPERGLVAAGFAYARPISVPAPPRTLFEWSLHPYRQPEGVPSPLQAAFGRDDFLGKGAIAVSAYQRVLLGKLPPDRVLSHDRLEGIHGRTVAVTDARLVEANVGDYLRYRARQHRWIRGDTHLMPWIARRGLPAPDRFGLARDLLGHLYAPAFAALLVAAWLAAPVSQAGWWTAALLALSTHPIWLTALSPQLVGLRFVAAGAARRDVRRSAAVWRRTLPSSGRLAAAEAARWLLSLAFLLDLALLSGDAVLRAGYRTVISHRNVLRWTSSAQLREAPSAATYLRRLLPTSLVAAGVGTAAASRGVWWGAPLLVLWFLTPLVACLSSRPARRLPDLSIAPAG